MDKPIKRTGVFADKDTIKSLNDSIKTPYMVFGGLEPISPQQLCHEYALKAGLPEINGYYGIDLNTGEFLRS